MIRCKSWSLDTRYLILDARRETRIENQASRIVKHGGTMSRVIGIDLGTTNSVAAVIEKGKPVVIPNLEGGRLTPSVVAFTRDGKRLVGQWAKRQAVANPDKTVFSIKRKMGRKDYWAENPQIIASIKRQMGSDYRVKIDHKQYQPEEISAMILSKIKRDAGIYLEETIEKAVITVPAYFNDSQRKATRNAGTIAGLDVLRIISEPTAAALAYGLDKEDIHTILVWDLGGGTFDVSILELGERFFEVKAVSGDTWLGGDDYDQAIVDWLLDELKKAYGIELREDNTAMQVLKEAAESAKIELSGSLITHIRLPFICGERLEIFLTREKFEELTKDLRQRMIGPTMQALSDAGLKPNEVDRVVLVGGATRMPAVQQLVKEITGITPYKHINPDEVVVLGAAIQAGILTGELKEVTLVDVNPLSLGIETMGGIFTKIIPRNTPIPTSRSQIFTTAKDNQTAVDIHVLQGEREMAIYNMTLDRFGLSGIETQSRGEPRIEVTFDIDVNSIVHVSAADLQTDNKKRIEITGSTELSKEEIGRMIKEAKIYAEEDRRKREEVEINIKADSTIAAAEYVIKQALDIGGTELEPEVDEVEKGILEVKEVLASGLSQKIKSKTHRLEEKIKILDRSIKEKRRIKNWENVSYGLRA